MKKREITEYIRERVKWWVRWTGLGWWKIDIIYRNEFDKKLDGERSKGCYGVCFPQWQYRVATIVFSLNAIKRNRLNKTDLEYAVVHELMHCFINTMREPGIEHEESAATDLARGFLYCRDGAKQIHERKKS